jgi:hypothetical protein
VKVAQGQKFAENQRRYQEKAKEHEKNLGRLEVGKPITMVPIAMDG